MKLVRITRVIQNSPYADGNSPFNAILCEDVEFTPCGVFLRKIHRVAGQPQSQPYVSRLMPPPRDGIVLDVTEVSS